MSEESSASPRGDHVRRLSEETVASVAAGEVITRPADVVVELIENALDAGAGRIDVDVAGDGTERIRVRDDGRGMSRRDAELAVERHTTSKLSIRSSKGKPRMRFCRMEEAGHSITGAGKMELCTTLRPEMSWLIRSSIR